MTPGAIALALLCCAIWGSNATAVMFTQDDLPPLGTAGLRFLISVPFLFLWFRVRGTSFRPKRGEGWAIAIISFFVFAQIGTFHFGLTRTNAAHASLLIGMHPALLAVMAHFALRQERLNRLMVVGLVVAGIGLIAIFVGEKGDSPDPVTLLGNAILLTSSLLLAVKLTYMKEILRRMDPGRLLVWSHLLGGLLLLVVSGGVEGYGSYRFTPTSIAGLAYVGTVVAVFCFATWTVLMQRHPITQLQTFAFSQPVFGVFFSTVFRGDPLTPWLVVGAVCIGLGIVSVTRGSNRRRRA
jgi:drug/metabolite transporter (DMT)-like permease